MARYVLFSPLGMTDPTRGCRDGAFIHISRFYKPQKAYLYMSGEICAFDELDNRYEVYLRKLCEKLDFDCEVKKIKHNQLFSVHDFEAFYGEFSRLVREIHDENPGCEVVVNLSSGTPQMKAALRIVCSLSSFRVLPVQVSSPAGKSNTEEPTGESYDIELEWEFNEDNSDGDVENRCTVVKSENFNALIKSEIISKHIAAYDYRAALLVAETVSDYIDPRIISLIKVGEQRLALNTGMAEMFARSVGYELLTVRDRSSSSKKVKDAFEYILALQIKHKKGELADFIRGISPVLTTMYEIYLKEKCGIDIEDYYKITGPQDRKTPKLSRNLLPTDLLEALNTNFGGEYKDSPPSAANLSPLIALKGDAGAAALAVRLRNIEERARNLAAHEIVAVTDKWIEQKTGSGALEILKMLKDFLAFCTAVPRGAWESYEQMNEYIASIPMIM